MAPREHPDLAVTPDKMDWRQHQVTQDTLGIQAKRVPRETQGSRDSPVTRDFPDTVASRDIADFQVTQE